MKKLLLYVLFIGMFLAFLEGSSYLLLRAFYDIDTKVNAYAHIVKSADYLTFDYEIGRIVPIPGKVIYAGLGEFTNRFETYGIPGLRAGFYGDGLNPDARYRVAVIGDSMTRGAGSVDNLKFGWVEMAERLVPNVDLVNLSNLGAASKAQLRTYKKIMPYIKHDTIFLNFSTGDDYVNEAFGGMDGSDYRNLVPLLLPPNYNVEDFLKKSQIALVYNAGCEQIASMPVKSYAHLVISKTVSSLWQGLYQAIPELFPTCPAHGPGARRDIPDSISQTEKLMDSGVSKIRHRYMPSIPDDLKDISIESRISVVNNVRFVIPDHFTDTKSASYLAEVAAANVNEFFRWAVGNGKKLVLVIHPTKEEVYFDLIKSNKLRPRTFSLAGVVSALKQVFGISSGSKERYFKKLDLSKIDVDLTREQFKSKLDPDIPILDLTSPLRRIAKKSDVFLYWRADSHYSPTGFLFVATLICHKLLDLFPNAADRPPAKACAISDQEWREAASLQQFSFVAVLNK